MSGKFVDELSIYRSFCFYSDDVAVFITRDDWWLYLLLNMSSLMLSQLSLEFFMLLFFIRLFMALSNFDKRILFWSKFPRISQFFRVGLKVTMGILESQCEVDDCQPLDVTINQHVPSNACDYLLFFTWRKHHNLFSLTLCFLAHICDVCTL